jgi:hypothetical protein
MKFLLNPLIFISLCQLTYAFEPVVFDASKGAPEQQDWHKDGSLETPLHTEGGHTYLDIDDTSPDDGAVFSYTLDQGTASDASSFGFVLEIHGRIEPSTGPTSQQVGINLPAARTVLVLSYFDNKQCAGLITQNAPKPTTSSLPGSDFHVWKIIGKPGDSGSLQLSFYVDKELVGGNLVPLLGAPPRLAFGAITGAMGNRVGHVLYEKVIFRPLENGE